MHSHNTTLLFIITILFFVNKPWTWWNRSIFRSEFVPLSEDSGVVFDRFDVFWVLFLQGFDAWGVEINIPGVNCERFRVIWNYLNFDVAIIGVDCWLLYTENVYVIELVVDSLV